MSGFSQMSNGNFMRLVDNPFQSFGLLNSNSFAMAGGPQQQQQQTEESKEPE